MLELLAFAPEDGWAYIVNDAEVRLIRPPFTRNSTSVVQKESVATAVTRHGFVLPPEGHETFPNWPALLDFLSTQLVVARLAKGSVVDDDAGEDLLAFAPADTLRGFLDRIGTELIPNCEWDHAEKLLLKMLAMPSFVTLTDLYKRAVDLLGQISKGRKKKQEELLDIAREDINFAKIFPGAAQHYGQQKVDELTSEIASRGTVFTF